MEQGKSKSFQCTLRINPTSAQIKGAKVVNVSL